MRWAVRVPADPVRLRREKRSCRTSAAAFRASIWLPALRRIAGPITGCSSQQRLVARHPAQGDASMVESPASAGVWA
jgi:hypothetical protein